MCGFLKTTVRFGLIAALLGGGVVAIAGHDRIGALVHQARADLNDRIDSEIDDAVALRAKLKDLESTLPKRIGQVRRDLEETSDQIAHLGQELEISKRVVALADRDLDALDTLLTRAENAHRDGPASVVRVRFRESVLTERQAMEKARSIERLRDLHAERADGLASDLGYLEDQRARLESLLDEMETEHAALQNEIWHLDRQVDAIERNERLIATMEKRERRIEEHSRYKSESLEEYRRQLAEVRTRQEARLARLNGTRDARSYEDRARLSLERGEGASGGDGLQPIELEETVIEREGEGARALAGRDGD